MNLLDMLRKFGDRLGIIEISVEPNKPAHTKIETRTITLDELVSLHAKDLQKLSQLPDELSVSFAEIFKTAGIETESGAWTVDRLLEFLQSDRMQGKDREETQREILKALAADKVDSAAVIKDAILRDQALDAYADFVSNKLQAMKDQQQQLERQIEAEQKKWKEWRSLKRQREKDMARAIGYLIDKPVITMDED